MEEHYEEKIRSEGKKGGRKGVKIKEEEISWLEESQEEEDDDGKDEEEEEGDRSAI